MNKFIYDKAIFPIRLGGFTPKRARVWSGAVV